MTMPIRYEIEAFNTATASENRIHDDGIARRFGFEGGLVPGVDVYAYLTRAAAIAFGEQFLSSGRIACRFDLPVYDGEVVAIEGQIEGEDLNIVLSGRGRVLASAVATCGATPDAVSTGDYLTADGPSLQDRPPAGSASLPDGRVLGTLREVADPEGQSAYRRDVRETLALYEANGWVHPGFLLRRANNALKDNVLLGPWIHVGSSVQHFNPLGIGAALETRSRVARLYDHKGHGFVELDVALFSGDLPIAQVVHTAIYEPRQVRESA